MDKSLTSEQRKFLNWLLSASRDLRIEETQTLIPITDNNIRNNIINVLRDGNYPPGNSKYYNALGKKYADEYKWHKL